MLNIDCVVFVNVVGDGVVKFLRGGSIFIFRIVKFRLGSIWNVLLFVLLCDGDGFK